ncbi:type I-C CRISPR-associated protein Cas7/Csd2 [Moraxella caviae]|uniref:Type I-C CRISPR-associated protein Cas7/Csd2 n=1 Tax=Moraxella caviae TaxID=34060 RepID=A0A1T0A4R8_9GAMM|nr:type I-C CRISPR-associated protein Cas7/Csd2 [Moraxella caviae]OOR90704.1 type I-C CRISPR-associated protein Cas7/Csd2 [Moraxella caviae]STZ14852.1 Uncharacterized protein predicted to be involved in DNA repair [Moraxella caviae]
MSLTTKIDFALILTVDNANPNGDPLNGNRPRTDFAGNGEITDVCLKRKIRDRLQEVGQSVFVQSDEKKSDDFKSLKDRAEGVLGKDTLNPKKTSREDASAAACQTWFDVRAFGQVFAFGKTKDSDGVSIAVRGPVTIQPAFSLEPVEIVSTQITKSVSGEGDGSKKASDTMGMKHRISHGVYVTYGAITPQLAERTGFSDDDAQVLKEILPKLFEGDASSARPEGSMQVVKLIWWQHNSKMGQYSSAKVHGSLKALLKEDGSFDEAALKQALSGLEPQIVDGF